MTIALEIDALACARGGRMLLRELSLRVEGGEVLGIEGPNGAGKTSLLRLVAGFLPPAAGLVRLITDKGELTDAEDRGKCAGWLGHQDGFKPQLTVGEQLRFFVDLYGESAATLPLATGAALEKAGLSRQRDLPCRYLSAGQRKRLALARLALAQRPLWLLDEPFDALDAGGKKFATDLIEAHAAGGGIALVATHEPLGGRTLNLGAAP